MIIQSIRPVLGNGKYLFGVFLIIFFTGIVLLYQEKVTPEEGSARAAGLEWLEQEEDPVAALDEAINVLLFVDNKPKLTNTLYGDYLLYLELRDYTEQRTEYDTVLNGLIGSYKMVQKMSVSTDVMKSRALSAQEQYEKLQGLQVSYGNHLTAEKFLKFGLAEIAFLLLLIYTAYFLIINEREKGIGALIHSTRNGGIRYGLYKLISFLTIAFLLILAVYGVKFLIYAKLFGVPEFSAPIQSADGYLSCPYRWSIGKAMLVFILLKCLFAVLLVTGLTVISSLALSEAAVCSTVAAIGVLYVILGNVIEDTSKHILIRDGGILKLWEFEYWVKGYYYAYLGGSENSIFHMDGLLFPIFMFLTYIAVFTLAVIFIYRRGLRKSSMKKGLLNRLWRYRSNVFGNEGQYVLFQKGIVFVFAAILFLGFRIMDTSDQHAESMAFEAEYVALLNGKSYEEACEWLDRKLEELDEMEQELMNLETEFAAGNLSEDAYAFAAADLKNQLQVRELAESLEEQTTDMDKVVEKYGIYPKFRYVSFTDRIWEDAGLDARLMAGMLVAGFVILGGLSVFPMDKQLGMNRLICTTAKGGRSIYSRLFWLCLMTFLMSIAVHFSWLFGLMKLYGVGWDSAALGFNAPAQGLPCYGSVGYALTLRTAAVLNIIWLSLKWTVAAFVAASLSLFASNAVWTEMIGTVVLLCPLALRMTGVAWVTKLACFSFTVYGFGDLLLDGRKLLIPFAVLAAGFAICRTGRKNWGR